MRMSDPPKQKLVIVVGPTAVGKTETAIRLAKALDGEIISADSRLFYRGMDIGTAKPTAEEMDGIPHHLIDLANPDETWSLAMFQQAAASAIADINNRGKLPFLVGGTGQYIRAVIEGWSPPEVSPNAALRLALENLAEGQGSLWLHQRLAVLDPPAAQIIDHRNIRRTIRALEVIFQTGQAFSAQRVRGGSAYNCLYIGLIRPRPQLYARVDARIEKMFADGLVDEARALLAAGYDTTLPSLSAIGYREAIQVAQRSMTPQHAIEEMKRVTRIFVRRQANWFKPNDQQIHWFNLETDPFTNIRSLVLGFLQEGKK